MARNLYHQRDDFFNRLAVSDESWFTISGHVLNRKTVVNWKKDRTGSPDEWFTEQKQGEKKIMVFSLMHGSGHLFGPYFLPHGSTFNGATYRQMLTDQVFPEMTVWQQVLF